MTYFQNVYDGKFYCLSTKGLFAMFLDGDKWKRSNRYLNADLSGFPFIAVNSTNC